MMKGIQKKVTWNDLHNANSADLMKTYKLSQREMEHQVRSHLDGANSTERRQLYQTIYSKKK